MENTTENNAAGAISGSEASQIDAEMTQNISKVRINLRASGWTEREIDDMIYSVTALAEPRHYKMLMLERLIGKKRPEDQEQEAPGVLEEVKSWRCSQCGQVPDQIRERCGCAYFTPLNQVRVRMRWLHPPGAPMCACESPKIYAHWPFECQACFRLINPGTVVQDITPSAKVSTYAAAPFAGEILTTVVCPNCGAAARRTDRLNEAECTKDCRPLTFTLPTNSPERITAILHRKPDPLPLTDPPTSQPHRELIFHAIGEASMCWTPIPTGVFDSTAAKKIGDEVAGVIQKHRKELEEQRDKYREQVLSLIEALETVRAERDQYKKELHVTQKALEIRRKFPNPALLIGRLVITTTNQCQGGPIIDSCCGETREGRRYAGKVFNFTPWRRTPEGDREGGVMLVLGWLKRREAE